MLPVEVTCWEPHLVVTVTVWGHESHWNLLVLNSSPNLCLLCYSSL
jgi:hypothetical protein